MSNDQAGMGSTPEEQLTIEHVPSGEGVVALVLAGELDPFTAPLFMAEIEGSLGGDVRTLELDLSALSFLDSSGLRVLVAAQKQLAPRGGGVVVKGATEITRRVIEISGLDRSFTLLPEP